MTNEIIISAELWSPDAERSTIIARGQPLPGLAHAIATAIIKGLRYDAHTRLVADVDRATITVVAVFIVIATLARKRLRWGQRALAFRREFLPYAVGHPPGLRAHVADYFRMVVPMPNILSGLNAVPHSAEGHRDVVNPAIAKIAVGHDGPCVLARQALDGDLRPVLATLAAPLDGTRPGRARPAPVHGRIVRIEGMPAPQTVPELVRQHEEVEQDLVVHVVEVAGHVRRDAVSPAVVAHAVDEGDASADVTSQYGVVEDDGRSGVGCHRVGTGVETLHSQGVLDGREGVVECLFLDVHDV
mmetsp:Transcript_30619/g.73942  ORF Transcript_30619/g.73942 Transcript_30619/m.73942 type:complete len:301 (+) Transcript_30619:243-1145(+)